MSSFSRPSSVSRSEEPCEPPKPWCLLTSASTPARSLFQAALMEPDTLSTSLNISPEASYSGIQEFRLAHVWGQRGFKIDLKSPHNIFYLRIDILHSFHDKDWTFLPNINILREIRMSVTTECRRGRPRWSNWTKLYEPMIRDFQFIPINYLSDSHSIVRHHHPLSFNCVEYQAPFDTIPPLRCHVHPYLAICNAVSKLADTAMDDLPIHIHQHVALAREIWEYWMRVAIPRPAINVGHIRASRQATFEGADIISFVPESSSSTLSTRSSSKVVSDDSSVSATSAEPCPLLEPHRYCALDRFYPFYAKPRRDPPVSRSAFIHAQSFDYRSEPQTESNASQSRKPLGIPSSGELHWWPDEQITRSCVSSASAGIWYTRCGKREFIHDDYICTKNDGSVNSYDTNISKPDPYLAFRPDYHELAQAKKLRDAERQRKREQDRLQEVDIVTWIRSWRLAVKHTKPLELKSNPISRNYSAEPSARPSHSSHHSWRPDSLPLWPTWTTRYRCQLLAVELSKRPKKRPASEDRPAKRRRI